MQERNQIMLQHFDYTKNYPEFLQVLQNLNILSIQNFQLKLYAESLQTQLSIYKKEKIKLLEDAELYKKSIKNLQKKESKRKYTKRRLWLDKKFICKFPNCEHRYSSKIALNLHLRKSHIFQIGGQEHFDI